MVINASQKSILKRWEDRTARRPFCIQCRHPRLTCYCHSLKPYSPPITFVILIQREESRRSIATGRMSHLILSNSYLFEGLDFSSHGPVQEILRDPQNACVLLFPGPGSVDISKATTEEKTAVFKKGKRPVVFVLDGTWTRAKRMRTLNHTLNFLPMIRFSPTTPSQFKIRKQPKAECYSTVEAIHEVIHLLAPDPQARHHHLLEVFNAMVAQQMNLESLYREKRKLSQQGDLGSSAIAPQRIMTQRDT